MPACLPGCLALSCCRACLPGPLLPCLDSSHLTVCRLRFATCPAVLPLLPAAPTCLPACLLTCLPAYLQRMAAMAQWRVIPLGLMAGLFGSLLDSLLGAALQFTGYDLASSSLTSKPGPSVQRISGLQRLPWLTDNVVNVLAASVTAALTALAALATFG